MVDAHLSNTNRYATMLWLLLGVAVFENFSCTHYINYIPDPKNDIAIWVKNFKNQKSFSYEYEMKTQAVHVRAKGNCVVGWAENIKGTWDYPAPEPDYYFEHIGVNDIEWTKKDSRWEESARGEESNIYLQIERMLNFDKFEYLNSENGFNYRFKANVPFLAPNRWNEMIGFLKVSKSTFLPEMIWAGLPDSSVYWQVKLSRFGHKKTVKPPVKDWNSYTVVFDSTENCHELIKKIKKRLKAAGVDNKISKKDSLIIIKAPSVYKTGDIMEALMPGTLVIYGIAPDRENASRVGYLKDDPAPIFLTVPLLKSMQIKKAFLGFDDRRRPYIKVLIKKPAIDLPERIALEIDSTIIGIASLDKGKNINSIIVYADMGYYKLNQIKSYINQELPFLKVSPMVKGSN